jgi:hypothetical protein
MLDPVTDISQMEKVNRITPGKLGSLGNDPVGEKVIQYLLKCSQFWRVGHQVAGLVFVV